MSSAEGICTALNLHNNQPCTSHLAPSSAVLCSFHAKQCHALYMGYKRRTAELSELEAKPPKRLPKNYQGTNWENIDDVGVLKDSHEWMLQRWKLLHRCVVAREEHHKHFYKDTSDYGHQTFIDRLKSTRNTISLALGRLDIRLLTLLHSAEEWFSWVREAQAAEDAASVAEKKKVKAEASLFREHQASVAAEKQREEEKRREEMEQEEVWDPIEMLVSNIRVGYITLVKLLLKEESAGEAEMDAAIERAKELRLQDVEERSAGNNNTMGKLLDFEQKREMVRQQQMLGLKEAGEDKLVIRPFKVQSGRKSNKENKGKDKENRKDDDASSSEEDEEKTAKDLMELKDIEDEELKELLHLINDFTTSSRGHIAYTADGNAYEKLKKELKEIREYLLLRLITMNPTILQVGLEKSNIDDFLNDERVRNTDLRDLALGLAKFDLQAVRDACADYWAARNPPEPLKSKSKNGHKWKTPEEQMKSQRVKVCGRWIHNYPLERRMARRGWMQFALLTCIPFSRALELCVSWEEFHELNVLACQGYFTGLPFDWSLGDQGGIVIQHISRIGFVTCGLSGNAADKTGPPPASGSNGKSNAMMKAPSVRARNWIFGVMGRNEPGARRFISICNAWHTEVMIYARDCKTGVVITEPPEEHRWLTQIKTQFKGGKRPSRAGWENVQTFNKEFLAGVQARRMWKQKFKDAIEICIIERRSGSDMTRFASVVTKLLNKAFKLRDGFSIMERTFNIYRRCAEQEHGATAPQVEKVKKLQEQMVIFRKGKTRKEMMNNESPEAYYDNIDREIDWRYAVYDNDLYWKRVGDELPATLDNVSMDELVERMNSAETEEEGNQWMYLAYAKMISNKRKKEYKDDEDSDSEDEKDDSKALTEKGKKSREPQSGREVRALVENEVSKDGNKEVMKYEDNAELVKSEDDEDWSDYEESNDEESDTDDMMWKDAEYEARDLMEYCEEFAQQIDQDFRDADPDSADKWAYMRDNMKSVARKKHDGKVHNQRELTRLKKRENAAMNRFQGTFYLPPNLTYCTRCVEICWGDDMEFEENFPTLFDKEGRAQNPPPRKTWKIPEKVFEEWDKMMAEREDGEKGDNEGIPEVLSKTIRMEIARLWKEGTLKPSWEFMSVDAIAGRIRPEPIAPKSQPPDNLKLFSDYRELIEEGAIITDHPEPWPPASETYLLDEVEANEKKHPGSIYSFIKLITDEYVWPEDLEKQTRTQTAIRDPQGRTWEWTKTPKDLPYSERHLHHLLHELTDARNMSPDVSKWCRFRIDTVIIIVPPKEEEEKIGGPSRKGTRGQDFTALACTGFRRRPVNVNIDWGRSFINVDAGFLRTLPKVWWE